MKALALLALSAVLVSACGHNVEQRAATGAIAGAAIGGPMGAVTGANIGSSISRALDR